MLGQVPADHQIDVADDVRSSEPMNGPLAGFGSFIVTFNRPDILRTTIEAVLRQTTLPELLLVVDNGTGDGARQVVAEFSDDRLEYEHTGENLGSAGGVAYGMDALYARGFAWMHSIDDDNPPRTPDTIERLQALIRRNDVGHARGDLGAVAAFGSEWDWKIGEYRRLPDDALTGDLIVDTVGGNSHLTVRREVIEAIGPPERRFFFGFYDPLYCLRMAKAGYRIMVDGDLMREYRRQAGRLDLVRHKSVVPGDPYHATWRRYYVTRNYIYRMTRTFDRPDLARREAGKALLRAGASWARGPRYGARYTQHQLRGIVDGYRGRLGRTVLPHAKPQEPGPGPGA
jgi:glycosyltransferase involved in cell wall biosynthesis